MGSAGKSDWIEIDAIVGSGAIDTNAPAEEKWEIRVCRRRSHTEPRGMRNGENWGRWNSNETHNASGVKVTNMLIAVRRMVESGNMVIFGANLQAIRKLAACAKIEKNMIVGKNGRRTEIKDEEGMYVYEMKIKKGKNDMDLGTVNKGNSSKGSQGVDYSTEGPF